MKKKESTGERIFTLLLVIPFLILEGYIVFKFATAHPIKFIITLPIMLSIIIPYMKDQVNPDDDWLEKLCCFQLGIFLCFFIFSLVFPVYDGMKKLFSSTDSDIEITEQYEECLRLHHYNESYCSYLKPIR